MLRNYGIGVRIGLGSALVLLVTLALITPTVLHQINDVVDRAEWRELRSLFDQINDRMAAEGRLAVALSDVIAHQPSIAERFAADDRAGLLAELEPVFKEMKTRYNVEQFQFHSPPAISYLRLHKPEKFGDDLSSFRHTVVEVNTQRKVVQGLEKGVAGLGIRGVVPVEYQGRHIGSVEFGMSFGQPFFDAIKEGRKDAGLELALHLKGDKGFEPFAQTYTGAPLLSDAELESALTTPLLVARALGGGAKSVYASVIKDYSDKPIGVLELAVDREFYVQAVATARDLALGIGVVALLLGTLIAWLTARSITHPLGDTVHAMDDIAHGEGDLTKRLDTSGRDEIGHLALAFNRFAEKVQRIVGQVAGSTAQLAAASEELSNITSHSNDSIQRQQFQTEQVVTAINEMTATVQEVARNAESAATAARQADGQARTGQEVVTATMDAIDTLAREVERAAEVIGKLEQDSSAIGKVLDVIQEIADQTNLLALNAAIEAARAGEQGRGFAVVADEVRTLASRTQDSTKEIQAMIEQLQKGARAAVKVMEEGRGQAQDSVAQAARAGDALASITKSVGTISDMNHQIASAAEEQSAVAEEINRNIMAINDITEENAKGAQQTAESSEGLAQLAGDLQGLVNQFKY